RRGDERGRVGCRARPPLGARLRRPARPAQPAHRRCLGPGAARRLRAGAHRQGRRGGGRIVSPAPISPEAIGLLGGWLVDRALADPRRGHPVALFGSWAALVESRTHRDARAAGVLTETIVLAPVLGLGVAASRLPPAGRAVATAALTWAAL